jgi:DNA-binding winged helix-turn-helix (wHTH) protein
MFDSRNSAMYRFRNFSFDSRNGELRRAGQLLALRPKSVLLLAFLLSDADRIHSKSDLVRAVWRHDQIDDQALFQLISEIRLALGDKACIMTYPNRGYRWGWTVKSRDGRNRLRISLGAAAAALIVVLAAGALWPKPPVADSSMGMSPAMSAVAQAIQARADGDLDRALALLEVAVQANPHFAAAKLELADVLRTRGDLERAQGYAHDALSDSRIIGDHYLEATAHVLLSKLRMTLGDRSGALRANAEAARIADDHGHVCAAQVSAAWQQQLTRALVSPDAVVALEESPSVAACEAALEVPQSWLIPDSAEAVAS